MSGISIYAAAACKSKTKYVNEYEHEYIVFVQCSYISVMGTGETKRYHQEISVLTHARYYMMNGWYVPHVHHNNNDTNNNNNERKKASHHLGRLSKPKRALKQNKAVNGDAINCVNMLTRYL